MQSAWQEKTGEAGLLSSARSTWRPLGVLVWLAVIRGLGVATEGAGVVNSRAKGKTTKMALPGARARPIRMALLEAKARATRMALGEGAEGRAIRMLSPGRVARGATRGVGAMVDSKLSLLEEHTEGVAEGVTLQG